MVTNQYPERVEFQQIGESGCASQDQRENRDQAAIARARSNANLRPFRKGVSGNANGRPKGESLTAVLRRVLDEVGKNGKTNAEMIARALVTAAKRGNVKAFSLIADRVDGKVPNKIEGVDAVPQKIIFEWVEKGLAGEGEEERASVFDDA